MANIISKLSVALGIETAEFNQGLAQAQTKITQAAAVGNILGNVVMRVGEQLIQTAKEAVTFANDMAELAQANDMAVSTVLEFSSALNTSGGHIENTAKILSSFTNKVDEAAGGSQKTRDSFKELGVSLDDLGKLSEEDLMRKTVKALAEMPDGIHRNALAFELFGKSMKTVDLKSLNNDLNAVKGAYDSAEDSFARIQAWGDKIAKSWFDAKVAMANFTVALVDSAEKNKEKLANINQYSRGFYGVERAEQNKGAPIDTTGHPDFTPEKIAPKGRETKQTPEQIAKAKQLAEEYKRQAEALAQQSAEFARQDSIVGELYPTYTKLIQEFEKGGKYARLKGTAEETSILNQALLIDQEKQYAAHAKEVSEQVIRQYERYDMAYKKMLDQAGLDKQRIDYQRTLVGMSDLQKQHAMELYDIEVEIAQFKKNNPDYDPKMVDKIREAKIAAVEAGDALRHAENSFQAGWDEAFANFVEKARDTAAMGAEAFNTMASSMTSALDNFVTTGKFSFGTLITSMVQDLMRLYIKAQMTNFFSFMGLGNMFGGTTALPEAGLSFDQLYAMGTGGYASGGDPPVGVPSLVGENGPELFVPKTAGTVIPNNQLSSALGGQQVVYNGPYIASMSAIDTQSALQFLAKNKQGVWAANQSAQRGMPMSRA